ncbi:MAG: hypothetical protein AXW12_00560 [Thalassospira sp. Nap_22]|nr:MAG: hypothetical protein AXW12_00560 [Thalassospira sp. Nap_22]
MQTNGRFNREENQKELESNTAYFKAAFKCRDKEFGAIAATHYGTAGRMAAFRDIADGNAHVDVVKAENALFAARHRYHAALRRQRQTFRSNFPELLLS